MLKLLAYLRHWRGPGEAASGPAPPYAVSCGCGQVLRGLRQPRRQIVPCPACGRKVFVLARSPLPLPEGDAAPAPRRASLGPWRLPLFAGMATLAILIILFIVLAPFLARPALPRNEGEALPDLRGQITAGRQALAQGDFHLASKELQAAIAQDQRQPKALSPAERGDLLQLQRQSDLLSRLLSRSLQEIVQEADPILHDEEWQARFARDYEGKSVLFDDRVRFDGATAPDQRRRPVLVNYRVEVDGKKVRVALEDLDVLQNLPLERPQRLLFGGRLARVQRGEGGRWVVGFAPDSGVLLTNRGAAEAVCPAPLDPELIDVLKRQAEWLLRQNVAGN